MAALKGAVPSALGPATAVNPADLVNMPAGAPATPIWPGAVDPAQYEAGQGDAADTQPRGGPVIGAYGAEQFAAPAPGSVPGGGGVQDTAWMDGHDAPEADWDSSAGEPFAPSGALDPELHAADTGGAYRKQHVTGPDIGVIVRHTGTGQTNVNLAPSQTTIGQTELNGRANYDQAQWVSSGGTDPRPIDYAERPILNNLAYQPLAAPGLPSPYSPDAGLPDRSPYPTGSAAYESPPDPLVPVQGAAAASSPSIGGGFVLQ